MRTRRSLIIAAGGGSLALLGGFGAYHVTRLPEKALRPWTLQSPAPTDVRLDALRHAILAPNPHNRQPWILQLVDEDQVIVTCDLNRRLPETDPFDRQITIGFGCFHELARIAAAERGYRMDIEPFPDGLPGIRLNEKPIARLKFTLDTSVAKDPLYSAILKRRTNKEEYDMMREVSLLDLEKLTSQSGSSVNAFATNTPAQIAEIRKLAAEAIAAEIDLPRTYQETVDIMRIGHKEIDENPDGVDLSGPLFEGLSLAGQLDRKQLADPSTMAFKQGREGLITNYGSALAFLWLTTANNTRVEQLAAGRDYVRMNLAANANGLAIHPVSQTLQEYPEMTARFTKMHQLLQVTDGARVQMLARVGYGPLIAPAPRWPLSARMLRL